MPIILSDIGRVEYIASFIVSIFILVMGIEILTTSFSKLFNNETNAIFNTSSYIIMVIAILVKFYMFSYNRKIGIKIDSETLKATATDSLCDSIATLFVIISSILSSYVSFNIDAISGILVAAFIIFTGIKTCKETMSPLIGRKINDETRLKIKSLVLSSPKVLDIHDLSVHDYGPTTTFVTLHAEVSSKEKLVEIHEVIDEIERKIKAELGYSATIHIDPVDIENPVIAEIYNALIDNVKKHIHIDASIHDLRLVKCKPYTKVIFDICLPYSSDKTESEIEEIVKETLNCMNTKYIPVIEIDRQ